MGRALGAATSIRCAMAAGAGAEDRWAAWCTGDSGTAFPASIAESTGASDAGDPGRSMSRAALVLLGAGLEHATREPLIIAAIPTRLPRRIWSSDGGSCSGMNLHQSRNGWSGPHLLRHAERPNRRGKRSPIGGRGVSHPVQRVTRRGRNRFLRRAPWSGSLLLIGLLAGRASPPPAQGNDAPLAHTLKQRI